MVYRWIESIQLALFPPCCLLCGARGSAGRDLCADCAAALPRLAAACPRCALPLAAGAPPLPCGDCQRRPPAFARARAAFHYAAPLDRLVTGLKFHGQLAAARLLGGLLAERLAGDPGPWPQALLPVPLHPRRLRQRGFNQALELARPLARELGLALLPDACVRRRDTAAQSGLERAARRRNVRGAFALPRPLGLRHVALVDDVMTTGQTLEALARVLREDGVEQVEVWCVARAGLEARPA